ARAEGGSGTTTGSARSRNGARSAAWAPAAASITGRSASAGRRACQLRRGLASSGRTALSSTERRSAQRVAEPWGSASASTVRCPRSAACAARWVASVVLPTPPLDPATRTVLMRQPAPIGLPAGYTGAGGGGRKAAGLLSFTAPIHGRAHEPAAGPHRPDPRQHAAGGHRDPRRGPGGGAVPAVADACLACAAPLDHH